MRAARVCLDARTKGKYCIGRGNGVPLTEAENKSLSLADVPATFVQAPIPGHLPNNLLLPDFLEQIQPHQILAGEEPVMKLRLTHLSDGCVVGISVSHMLAGIVSHFGSAVQCSAVQCSAVQCSAVQCSAVQCSTSAFTPCCRKQSHCTVCAGR